MKQSKAQQAKDAQGYRTTLSTCCNCNHYRSEMFEVYRSGDYVFCQEKVKRCSLGGFAVQKMATCDRHEPTKEMQHDRTNP